jgi:hypothetical protein
MNDYGNPPKEEKNAGQGNRFTFTPKQEHYSDKTEYLKALSLQLTPDAWSAIVARAIHDATFGKGSDRAKAREWFAKFLLPDRMGTELFKVSQPVHDFLSEVYQLFHSYARNTKDIESGLATTLGALRPEERATLRKVLIEADSEEVRKFWDDPKEEKGQEEGASKR